MSYEFMQVAPSRGSQFDFSWETEVVLSSPGNSQWFLVPRSTNFVVHTLSPNPTGEGRVQITTEKVESVMNDTATGVDWPHGNVTTLTQDACVAITAFRIVNVSGSIKLNARAT